jgi:hypothetical protein
MKIFKLAILLVLLSSITPGCQKSIDILEETPTIQLTDEYRLMTPAYYRESEDGASIQVRFYESPRIYDLSKSHKDFECHKSINRPKP